MTSFWLKTTTKLWGPSLCPIQPPTGFTNVMIHKHPSLAPIEIFEDDGTSKSWKKPAVGLEKRAPQLQKIWGPVFQLQNTRYWIPSSVPYWLPCAVWFQEARKEQNVVGWEKDVTCSGIRIPGLMEVYVTPLLSSVIFYRWRRVDRSGAFLAEGNGVQEGERGSGELEKHQDCELFRPSRNMLCHTSVLCALHNNYSVYNMA